MRDITYPPVIWTAKALFKALGMKFQTSGAHHIPRQGGAILAANHIGYVDFVFDGLAAQPSKRLVRFMAKKQAFDHPISGPVMRSLHHISVDRNAGEQAYTDAVDSARAGEIVGVFPEATISRSFEIKELKTGAVRMAAAAGVPLVPMVTWGTQRLKTKDHPSDMWARGRTIGLHVGEPLQVTGSDPADETARLRSEMSTLLDRAITQYPLSPHGKWWAPARYGGTAPSLDEAADMDAAEYAKRSGTMEA